MRKQRNFLVFLALLAGSTLAQPATMYDITGPSPFGFANQQVLVQGWTQSISYSNVTIAMPLEDNTVGGPIGGVEGTVYLMNQFGPGTTVANEVAPPVAISGLTAAFVTRTLFSGLTLPAGNYYVVLFSTNTNPLSMSPEGSSTPVATTGLGVFQAGGGSSLTPDPYPPASAISFSPTSNRFITVTGDPIGLPPVATAVPTVNSFGLGILLLVMVGAAFLLFRQRRA